MEVGNDGYSHLDWGFNPNTSDDLSNEECLCVFLAREGRSDWSRTAALIVRDVGDRMERMGLRWLDAWSGDLYDSENVRDWFSKIPYSVRGYTDYLPPLKFSKITWREIQLG
jgi:hypothetical protein